MFSTLTKGLTTAVRVGVAPLIVASRIAERRRSGTQEGIPDRVRGWRTEAKALLDDLFFATELAMAPMVSPRDRKRLSGELHGNLELFDNNGWLDDPTGYHNDPPPLAATRIDELRARFLPYRHLRFESEYEPPPKAPGRDRWLGYEPNRTGHAWLLKHPGPQRPWLVCIPGYRMGNPLVDFTGFRAHWLYRHLGLNVAVPVMPLHGPRRVGRRGGDGFFSGDFVDTLHAQAQAVWDIRRLTGWLRSQGAPAIGTYGVSLGGYTAALHASLDSNLDCVIVGVPATDFLRLIQSHTPGFAIRAAKAVGVPFDAIEQLLSVVSPFGFEPKVPHERRFLYAGVADQLTTPDHARDLWRHWDEPRVAWYQGGHVSFLWQPEVRDLIHEALITSGLIQPQLAAFATNAA
jgi:dienelactone hydrolase